MAPYDPEERYDNPYEHRLSSDEDFTHTSPAPRSQSVSSPTVSNRSSLSNGSRGSRRGPRPHQPAVMVSESSSEDTEEEERALEAELYDEEQFVGTERKPAANAREWVMRSLRSGDKKGGVSYGSVVTGDDGGAAGNTSSKKRTHKKKKRKHRSEREYALDKPSSKSDPPATRKKHHCCWTCCGILLGIIIVSLIIGGVVSYENNRALALASKNGTTSTASGVGASAAEDSYLSSIGSGTLADDLPTTTTYMGSMGHLPTSVASYPTPSIPNVSATGASLFSGSAYSYLYGASSAFSMQGGSAQSAQGSFFMPPPKPSMNPSMGWSNGQSAWATSSGDAVPTQTGQAMSLNPSDQGGLSISTGSPNLNTWSNGAAMTATIPTAQSHNVGALPTQVGYPSSSLESALQGSYLTSPSGLAPMSSTAGWVPMSVVTAPYAGVVPLPAAATSGLNPNYESFTPVAIPTSPSTSTTIWWTEPTASSTSVLGSASAGSSQYASGGTSPAMSTGPYRALASWYLSDNHVTVCGYAPTDLDYVVALSSSLFAQEGTSLLCGKSIQVINTANQNNLTIIVADECAECSGLYGLDLSRAAFMALAGNAATGSGSMDVEWDWV